MGPSVVRSSSEELNADLGHFVLLRACGNWHDRLWHKGAYGRRVLVLVFAREGYPRSCLYSGLVAASIVQAVQIHDLCRALEFCTSYHPMARIYEDHPTLC